MRASPRLIADVRTELKRLPDKAGKQVLVEYLHAVNAYENVLDECNYEEFIPVASELSSSAKAMQHWLDNRERAKRK
jgi:phage-related protein